MPKEFTADYINEELMAGRAVTIPGVVKLKPVDRAARKGRNPATGESIDIPARRDVKATVSPTLRSRLNGS